MVLLSGSLAAAAHTRHIDRRPSLPAFPTPPLPTATPGLQGDGTAAIFAGRGGSGGSSSGDASGGSGSSSPSSARQGEQPLGDVFTLSVHGANNFPTRKQASTLDVGLPDGTGDEQYLR